MCDDVEATVEALKARGVACEPLSTPGLGDIDPPAPARRRHARPLSAAPCAALIGTGRGVRSVHDAPLIEKREPQPLTLQAIGGLGLDHARCWTGARRRACRLRPPRAADHKAWAELRDQSRDFLQPWEPTWPADDLSRAGVPAAAVDRRPRPGPRPGLRLLRLPQDRRPAGGRHQPARHPARRLPIGARSAMAGASRTRAAASPPTRCAPWRASASAPWACTGWRPPCLPDERRLAHPAAQGRWLRGRGPRPRLPEDQRRFGATTSCSARSGRAGLGPGPRTPTAGRPARRAWPAPSPTVSMVVEQQRLVGVAGQPDIVADLALQLARAPARAAERQDRLAGP